MNRLALFTALLIMPTSVYAVNNVDTDRDASSSSAQSNPSSVSAPPAYNYVSSENRYEWKPQHIGKVAPENENTFVKGENYADLMLLAAGFLIIGVGLGIYRFSVQRRLTTNEAAAGLHYARNQVMNSDQSDQDKRKIRQLTAGARPAPSRRPSSMQNSKTFDLIVERGALLARSGAAPDSGHV